MNQLEIHNSLSWSFQKRDAIILHSTNDFQWGAKTSRQSTRLLFLILAWDSFDVIFVDTEPCVTQETKTEEFK